MKLWSSFVKHSFFLCVLLGVASLLPSAHAEALIESDSRWFYWDHEEDPPANWKTSSVSKNWKKGIAQLGYGDDDEATVIEPFRLQYFFRKRFINTSQSGTKDFIGVLTYDDAAIVYLNGKEVYRTPGMGDIGDPIPARKKISPDNAVASFTIKGKAPKSGFNTVAVHLFNHYKKSSDVSFAFSLAEK